MEREVCSNARVAIVDVLYRWEGAIGASDTKTLGYRYWCKCALAEEVTAAKKSHCYFWIY